MLLVAISFAVAVIGHGVGVGMSMGSYYDVSFAVPGGGGWDGIGDLDVGDDERRSSFRPTRRHPSIEYRIDDGGGGSSNRIDDDGGGDVASSSSYRSPRPDDVRISFELHDPKTAPLTNVFNPHVLCPLGMVKIGRNKPTGQNRTGGGLPPSLVRADVVDVGGERRDRKNGTSRVPPSGRVLDLTVSMSTDLKVLFVGDSVMVQLAQAVDEFFGGRELGSRTVLRETWTGHDGQSVVAPTRGGGVSAMWRMTGLISTANRGKAPAPSGGGGWDDADIERFLSHSYYRLPTSTTGGGGSSSSWREERPPTMGDTDDGDNSRMIAVVGNFDAVVFRVMHGWMEFDEITHDRLVEAVELSHALLGATSVVLMTVPFTNNVKTPEDMDRVNEINNDIRRIARTWHTRTTTNGVDGLRHVLVLEYGTYVNHVIWSNARHLNYTVTHPLDASPAIFDSEGPKFLLDRLDEGGKFPPSAPMVCSSTPNRGKCDRNSLFRDGMHVCPDALASRYAAGVACLLGCVYNRRGPKSARVEGRIRTCETECNEQFLSVMPVEESWIDTHTTLASFSD